MDNSVTLEQAKENLLEQISTWAKRAKRNKYNNDQLLQQIIGSPLEAPFRDSLDSSNTKMAQIATDILGGKSAESIYDTYYQIPFQDQARQNVIQSQEMGGLINNEINIVVSQDIVIDIEVEDEQLLKLLRDKYENQINLIMRNAFYHFAKMINDHILDQFCTLENQTLILFEKISAINQKSGGSGDVNLLPDNFEYNQLLPPSIKIVAHTTSYQPLLREQNPLKVNLKHKQDGQAQFDPQDIVYKRKQRNLCNFMDYFKEQRICYPFIDRQELTDGVKKVNTQFFGIETFMQDFEEQLVQFTEFVESYPKGILLYGPPGTGKSAITKALCKALGLYFATGPMAAGDLKKGIVGDSERTVNAIANRARLVPWQMCLVFIDEIDSLAPDRNSGSAGNSGEDLIGVLLATLDGSKTTENLKIIATTNLLNKIDSAFLRRMEIQLFLGNPSKNQRELWISKKSIPYQKKDKDNRIKEFVEEENFVDLRGKMIEMTINFSADAYRKLLERYFLALLILKNKPNKEQYQALLIQKIRQISSELKIYFGGKLVCEVLTEAQNLQERFSKHEHKNLIKLANGEAIRDKTPSKIMLLDLATEQAKEKIQVVVSNDLLGVRDDNQGLLYGKLQSLSNSQERIECHQEVDMLRMIFDIIREFPLLESESQLEADVNDIITQISNLINGLMQTELLDELYENPVVYLQDNTTWRTIKVRQAQHKKNFALSIVLDLFGQINRIYRFEEKKLLHLIPLLLDYQEYQDVWPAVVLEFGMQYDADIVILIDHLFLIQNKAYDDQSSAAIINEAITETRKYNKAVIIFDLDSISGIKKEYQSLKEDIQVSNSLALEGGENGAAFSYHYQRPVSFETSLNFIRQATNKGPIWYIAVSNHNKVILDFKQAVAWPPTESEINYQTEEEMKEQKYRCIRCKEIFSSRENEFEFKCRRHANFQFVYDEPGLQRKEGDKQCILSAQKVQEKINKEKALPIHFKYTCCGGILGSKGEIPCKHEGNLYDPTTDSHTQTEENYILNL